MAVKPLIQLYDAIGIGLIIKYPSGVRYSNQVGGVACLQWEAEGVYVPLYNDIIPQEQMLRDHFTGHKWKGACFNGIDTETADYIDDILQANITTRFIRVDRNRLDESVEAWIHVLISAPPDKHIVNYDEDKGIGVSSDGDTMHDKDHAMPVLLYPIFGFGESYGILTWTNSD